MITWYQPIRNNENLKSRKISMRFQHFGPLSNETSQNSHLSWKLNHCISSYFLLFECTIKYLLNGLAFHFEVKIRHAAAPFVCNGQIFPDISSMNKLFEKWFFSQSVLVAACINIFRPRHYGRHCADGILKCVFLDDSVWIPVEIALNLFYKGPIDNIPALI